MNKTLLIILACVINIMLLIFIFTRASSRELKELKEALINKKIIILCGYVEKKENYINTCEKYNCEIESHKKGTKVSIKSEGNA